MYLSSLKPLVGALVCMATVGAANASFTVGTFADPAAGSWENFFEYNRLSSNTVTLEGAWQTDGLHLLTPGIAAPDQFNARFELRNAQDGTVLTFIDASNNGDYRSGPGYVRFFDAGNSTILRIDFDVSQLTNGGFTAGNFAGTNANMSGPIVEPGWSDEQFAFAFANLNVIDSNTFTWSGSFTSSAVPEPATVVALALGGVAVLRRRKSN